MPTSSLFEPHAQLALNRHGKWAAVLPREVKDIEASHSDNKR